MRTVAQLHDPRGEQSVRHACDIEFALGEHRRDGAQVACAIDFGEHLPFAGTEVEQSRMIVGDAREHGNDAQMRDLSLDARPFVDAPRGLHEQ